jgi:hypothetical protein
VIPPLRVWVHSASPTKKKKGEKLLFQAIAKWKYILFLIQLHCSSTGSLAGGKQVYLGVPSGEELEEGSFPSLIYLFRLRNHWFRNYYGDKRNWIPVCSGARYHYPKGTLEKCCTNGTERLFSRQDLELWLTCLVGVGRAPCDSLSVGGWLPTFGKYLWSKHFSHTRGVQIRRLCYWGSPVKRC